MSKTLVTFDDFSGGDWGQLGSKRAAKNQFHGVNMLYLPSGELAPRPGVRDMTDVGFLGNMPATTTPLIAMGQRAGQGRFWFAYVSGGMRVVRASTSGSPGFTPMGAAAATTHLNAVTCQSFDEASGLNSYFAASDGVWRINHVADTHALVAGSPTGGKACVRYGDRLIIGVARTLHYSAPADFATWPATNTIPVGAAEDIAGLYVVRGSLVILKTDYSVWVLTGVPGVNEYLREVIPRYDGYVDDATFTQACVERGARLWMAVKGMDDPLHVSPTIFGGSAMSQEFPTLELDTALRATNFLSDPLTAYAAMIGLHRTADVALFGGGTIASSEGNVNALFRTNGVWTKHAIAWPDGVGTFTGHAQMGIHVGQGRLIVAVEEDSGFAWRPVSAQCWWDSVPVAGTDPFGLMRLGDSSDTAVSATLDLADFWAPDADQIRVHNVLVDVNASAASPSLSMQLVQYGLDPVDQPSVGTASTAVQTRGGGSGYTTYRFAFEPITSRAVQVKMSAIRGVSIRRVTVLGDLDPSRS